MAPNLCQYKAGVWQIGEFCEGAELAQGGSATNGATSSRYQVENAVDKLLKFFFFSWYNINKILGKKEYFKSAYRRIHLRASTAVKSAIKIVLDGKAYVLISLRLSFGGAACPSKLCLVSDIIIDTLYLLAQKANFGNLRECHPFVKRWKHFLNYNNKRLPLLKCCIICSNHFID